MLTKSSDNQLKQLNKAHLKDALQNCLICWDTASSNDCT